MYWPSEYVPLICWNIFTTNNIKYFCKKIVIFNPLDKTPLIIGKGQDVGGWDQEGDFYKKKNAS